MNTTPATRCEAPGLVAWVQERVGAGDEVAQHGLVHRQRRPARAPRRWVAGLQAGAEAEFVGLDPKTTRRFVERGSRLLQRAGTPARGFVAPGYAYTRALRQDLDRHFEWWGTQLRVHLPGSDGREPIPSAALTLGTSTPAKRALSPLAVRAGARGVKRLMRLEVHPADFNHPFHVRALESVLQDAAPRTPITYDQLLMEQRYAQSCGHAKLRIRLPRAGAALARARTSEPKCQDDFERLELSGP